MKKASIILAVTILLIPVLYYTVFQIRYYYALEKSNRDAKAQSCAEETAVGFTGRITGIDRYEYNEYMNQNWFAIEVQVTDSNHLSYQFSLKANKDLLAFVSIGDSIIKHAATNNFLVAKAHQKRKTFVMPACKE
jgi:hypothetical protein